MGVLVLDRVTKQFDGVTAVDGLSLEIPPGVIYGLLGPNGAGKTTTIRTILGILKPDSGTVTYADHGEALSTDRVGYLPEERGLYPKMKVLDLLVFLARLKSVQRSDAVGRVNEWLGRFGLQDWAKRQLEQLSKGMQQKVQFIAAVLHDPDVVILDEPFSGLDPINVELFKNVVLELRAAGKTLVFSTHQMEDAERLCDRVCLINKGLKVLDGPIEEVKARFGRNRVRIAFDGDGGFLKDAALIRRFQDYNRYVEAELQPGVDSQAVLSRAMAGARIHRFELAEPSLRDIFLTAVGSSGAEVASDG